MAAPSEDGGSEPVVVPPEELARLARRAAASVRARLVPAVEAAEPRAQLHALAALLDAVALRLETQPAPPALLEAVEAALDAGDVPGALRAARALVDAERSRVAAVDWDALSAG